MKTLNELSIKNRICFKKARLLLGVACGTLLITSCGGGMIKKEKGNDWVTMELKGQVKKMVVKKSPSDISLFYTFNEKGYFKEKGQISSWPTNKTIITEQYEYDADGKLSCISFFSNISGDLQSKQIYKDGVLVEEQKYAAAYPESKLSSIKYYAYDKDGLLTKSWTDQNEQNRAEYECDGTGNITKLIGYSMDKVYETCKTGYEYDNRGNITKHEIYYRERKDDLGTKDGMLNYVEEYKYDNDSRVLERNNITYRYNSGKKENEISQKQSYTYKYDEQDNVVEMSCLTYGYRDGKEQEPGAPAITTYVYTYDKHGNWTSRETKYKGRKQEVVSRKYSYYGEEESKFSAEDMVGIWDYYAESDPQNKIEIVFKKDGTLIDYIDFHSTGTYKVNEDGSIVTMQFFYNDGETSQESKPFEYKVLEHSEECFKITNGGSNPVVLVYDKKEKSDNYTGEF